MNLSSEVTKMLDMMTELSHHIAKQFKVDHQADIEAIHITPGYLNCDGVPMTFDVKVEIKV